MNFLGHTSTNCFIAGSTATLAYTSNLVTAFEAISYCGAFIFATLMLGPDLDLYHSRVNKNWGLFRILWWPYSKVFKHRGMSHTPVVSSVVRISYLCVVAMLAWVSGLVFFTDVGFAEFSQDLTAGKHDGLLNVIQSFCVSNKGVLTAAFAGVVMSDLVHLFADHYSSFKKKWLT